MLHSGTSLNLIKAKDNNFTEIELHDIHIQIEQTSASCLSKIDKLILSRNIRQNQIIIVKRETIPATTSNICNFSVFIRGQDVEIFQQIIH